MKEEIDAYISTRIESIKDLLYKDPGKVKEFLSLALSYESTALLQNYYDIFSKIFNSVTIPGKFKEKSLIKKGIEDLLEDIVALLNGPDGILGKNSKMFKNFEGGNIFLSEECKIYAREKIEEYIKE